MSYKELRSYLYDMRVMALAEAANNDAVEWPRLCFELESAMAIFNLDDVLACFVDGEFMCEVDDLLDRYYDAAKEVSRSDLMNWAINASRFVPDPEDVECCCLSCHEQIRAANILNRFKDDLSALVHVRNRISFLAQGMMVLASPELRRAIFSGRHPERYDAALDGDWDRDWLAGLSRMRQVAEDYRLDIPKRLLDNTVELVSVPRVSRILDKAIDALQPKAA